MGGRLHIDVDGTTAVAPVDLLSTGSGSAFRTFQLGSVTLTPGMHLLRLSTDASPQGQAGIELNWMRFSAPGVAPSPAAVGPRGGRTVADGGEPQVGADVIE